MPDYTQFFKNVRDKTVDHKLMYTPNVDDQQNNPFSSLRLSWRNFKVMSKNQDLIKVPKVLMVTKVSKVFKPKSNLHFPFEFCKKLCCKGETYRSSS